MHRPSFERSLRWTNTCLYHMETDWLRIMREQGLDINVRYQIWDHVGIAITRDVEGLVSGIVKAAIVSYFGKVRVILNTPSPDA